MFAGLDAETAVGAGIALAFLLWAIAELWKRTLSGILLGGVGLALAFGVASYTGANSGDIVTFATGLVGLFAALFMSIATTVASATGVPAWIVIAALGVLVIVAGSRRAAKK